MTKRAAKPTKHKKVAFGGKPEPKPAAMDSWVKGETAPEPGEAAGPLKRLTIDMPAPLHTRVKTQCAEQNLIIAKVVRDFLEQRFPPK